MHLNTGMRIYWFLVHSFYLMDAYDYTGPNVIASYITSFGLERICFNRVRMDSYQHKTNLETDKIRKYLYQTTITERSFLLFPFITDLPGTLTNMA